VNFLEMRDDAEALRHRTDEERARLQPFLESLASLKPEGILKFIGIPWDCHPSVKLVRREERGNWERLPWLVGEQLRALGARSNLLLAASYNKLKHGPQMVVMDPIAVATTRRGFTPAEVGETDILRGDFVRLLFDGARTQEEPGELEKGNRVAPFLIHDAAALTDVFVQMSSAAMCVRDIAFWLYRSQFREDLPHEADLVLREIAEKNLIRLKSRMPFEDEGS
jgi:hypothetical protein